MRVYLLLPLLGMAAGLSVPQEDGLIEDPLVKGEAHIENEERAGRGHYTHHHWGKRSDFTQKWWTMSKRETFKKEDPLIKDASGEEERTGRCNRHYCGKRSVDKEDPKKSEEMLPNEESMEKERTGRFIKIFKLGKRAVTEDELLPAPKLEEEPFLEGHQDVREGRVCQCIRSPCNCGPIIGKRSVGDEELKKSEEMLPKEESMEEERTGRFVKIFKRAVGDEELKKSEEMLPEEESMEEERNGRFIKIFKFGKRAVEDEELKKPKEMPPKEESMEEERTGRFIKIFKLGKRAVTDDELLPAPEIKEQSLMEDQEARKGRCRCFDSPCSCKRAVGDEDLKRSEEMLPKEESMEEERTGRKFKIFKIGKRAVTEDELLPAPELEEQPLLEGHQEARKGRCKCLVPPCDCPRFGRKFIFIGKRAVTEEEPSMSEEMLPKEDNTKSSDSTKEKEALMKEEPRSGRAYLNPDGTVVIPNPNLPSASAPGF